MTTQAHTFRDLLAAQYRELFTTAEYATAASRMTPEVLATRMTDGLKAGTASKDGDGIKRTCKILGIKPTYAAIKQYLNG